MSTENSVDLKLDPKHGTDHRESSCLRLLHISLGSVNGIRLGPGNIRTNRVRIFLQCETVVDNAG